MTSLNGWFVRKTCSRCGWSFQCPEEQERWRATCFACVGKVEKE